MYLHNSYRWYQEWQGLSHSFCFTSSSPATGGGKNAHRISTSYWRNCQSMQKKKKYFAVLGWKRQRFPPARALSFDYLEWNWFYVTRRKNVQCAGLLEQGWILPALLPLQSKWNKNNSLSQLRNEAMKKWSVHLREVTADLYTTGG